MIIDLPIVIYDGKCIFCSSFMDFVLAIDKTQQLRFTPNTSNLAKVVFRTEKIANDIDYIVFYRNGKVYTKSDAIFEILKFTKHPLSYLFFLKFIPRGVRDFVYDIIAKKRYLIMKKKSYCTLNNLNKSNRVIYDFPL